MSASASRVGTQDNVQAWISHHKSSAMFSLQKIFSTPFSSLLTWLVIGIALALPMILMLVVENIKTLGGRWEGDPRLTVYMQTGVSNLAITELGTTLHNIPGIDRVEYISPEMALAEFKKHSGLGETLPILERNPLPPVYILTPSNNDAETLGRLSRQMKTFSGVDFVGLDLEWVQKLQQMVHLAERFIMLMALLFSLGVLLTIGNTIRLAIESRKEEIVVIKLVGATDSFVRRPFLYTGLWNGIAGGVIACFLVLASVSLLKEPAYQLAGLYGSDFSVTSLGLAPALILAAGGGALGLGGAWLAVARHLHLIEPR